MNKYKFVIRGELPSMNEIIKETKRWKSAYNSNIKSVSTNLCKLSCLKLQKIDFKAFFLITFYCKNKKKDPDNIDVAKKFIFDGMVNAGKLKNDGWKQIGGFHPEFYVDKTNPRIEVEIFRSKSGMLEEALIRARCEKL